MKKADILAMTSWLVNKGKNEVEIAFSPARVLMQDFTGVPAVVDLAAMRDAASKLGANPERINPLVPVDLVIDHSRHGRSFRRRRRLQAERRTRIRAQRRALPIPALGPASVPRFPRRAARHRHLPPGEPRISRPIRLGARDRRRNLRLSRHRRRHRLATPP